MPLRILCLHGFAQTGDALRVKMGAVRKYLGKRCEFVFCQAPHLALTAENGKYAVQINAKSNGVLDGFTPNGEAWWYDPSHQYGGVPQYEGIEESLAAICDVFRDHGPFDGCFGFSQGAAMLGLLVSVWARNRSGVADPGAAVPSNIGRGVDFRFAVFVSSFLPRDEKWAAVEQDYSIQQRPVLESLATLHIYGRSDEIISADRSAAFAELFPNKQVIEHAGGHFIPSDPDTRKAIRDFIEQFIASE